MFTILIYPNNFHVYIVKFCMDFSFKVRYISDFDKFGYIVRIAKFYMYSN